MSAATASSLHRPAKSSSSIGPAPCPANRNGSRSRRPTGGPGSVPRTRAGAIATRRPLERSVPRRVAAELEANPETKALRRSHRPSAPGRMAPAGWEATVRNPARQQRARVRTTGSLSSSTSGAPQPGKASSSPSRKRAASSASSAKDAARDQGRQGSSVSPHQAGGFGGRPAGSVTGPSLRRGAVPFQGRHGPRLAVPAWTRGQFGATRTSTAADEVAQAATLGP